MELRAKIDFTIWDKDMNIVYSTDIIISGQRELGDAFDILRTDYLDVLDEQDRHWSTTERKSVTDTIKRFKKPKPRITDPKDPNYNWWDNVDGIEE
jgi:hypothetical protein